jgi:mycothiol maleylpyruvate isomerase-like protein
MSVDRSFVERNRASSERIRALAARLSDEELQTRVGEHWTVAIVFAHLAFLDRRALYVLDATERAGEVVNPDFNIFINDVALPLWAAIPPREAARICLETAETLDRRLETYPPQLLELIRAEYKRYLFRVYHRTEHLDEAEAALKS